MVNTSVLRSVLCLGFKELQPFGGDSAPLLSGHRIDPRRFEQARGIQLLERLHEFGQRHLGAEGAFLGGEASPGRVCSYCQCFHRRFSSSACPFAVRRRCLDPVIGSIPTVSSKPMASISSMTLCWRASRSGSACSIISANFSSLCRAQSTQIPPVPQVFTAHTPASTRQRKAMTSLILSPAPQKRHTPSLGCSEISSATSGATLYASSPLRTTQKSIPSA